MSHTQVDENVPEHSDLEKALLVGTEKEMSEKYLLKHISLYKVGWLTNQKM